MAYAGTTDGLARIRASAPYLGLSQVLANTGISQAVIDARAISAAVRQIHAEAAQELSVGPVPGTDQYLISDPSVRDSWGRTCGLIGASHHWNLERVEHELGRSGGVAPLPGNRHGDLAYVACLLRIIDYAHINRDRAPKLDRAFRAQLEEESLTHWLAQQDIDGPQRDGNELVYRSARPIADVNAWWLYYSMLNGLDAEIRAVRRYLDRRLPSQTRLSIQGVRGAGSPDEAAVYIQAAGFLPIEVSIRTGSIQRLVELLAGESLYGPNPMAAVRELIQNASDAVGLKAALAETDVDRATVSLPIRVALRTSGVNPILEITDHGIGMNSNVMTRYLITIASDYWQSQFHTDFPDATTKGFRPAGKFGIGFLSVFMLGDAVSVESNRLGQDRLRLTLRGVGRRGELYGVRAASGSGTRVQLQLKTRVVEVLKRLQTLLPMYAPLLPQAISIDVDGLKTEMPAGWIRKLPSKEFCKWTLEAISEHQRMRIGKVQGVDTASHEIAMLFRVHRYRSKSDDADIWPAQWPEYQSESARLVASFEGSSLLCLRGLAIQPISTPGFVGLINVDFAVPDVSRTQLIAGDLTDLVAEARQAIKSQIIANLDALEAKGLLIDKIEFIGRCTDLFGPEVLRSSTVPWISVLTLPGEMELVNSAAFLERVAKARTVFIGFNSGPWTTMREWAKATSGAQLDDLAIVLDDAGQPTPKYLPKYPEEEKIGSIEQLWPESERSVLFTQLLNMTAEAWQVTPADLRKQDGWLHKSDVLFGRLQRP
jgi:hypothetical protein